MKRIIIPEVKSGHDGRFYYIYKITNLVNQKFYYGKHSTQNITDDYCGSGKLLKHAYKKYGKDSFVFEIVSFHDTMTELNLHERNIVTEDIIADKQCYNLKIGGEGGYCRCDECNRKRIASCAKSEKCKDVLRRMSLKNKGSVVKEETKLKISKANRARIRTEEERRKISLAKKGVKSIIVMCPHCGLSGGLATMKQSHFNHCGKRAIRNVSKVECPHCGKEGNANIMKRWHFDNCKEIKN